LKYDEFKDLIIFLKNSISPTLSLNEKTIKLWHEMYFRYYDRGRLEKVFKFLAENGEEFTLVNIKNTFIEFFGYFLPTQVEYCLKIMSRAKQEGVKVKKDSYPLLKDKYDLPLAEAWEIAFNEKGEENGRK